MKQQIIRENPVRRILYYVFSFVVCFIFTTFLLGDDSVKILYWAINIFAFVFSLLLIIFEEDKTIICDEVGCTVKEKRFWQASGKHFDFKWKEVSETEYVADAESNREFFVEVDGVKRKILNLNSSLDNFDFFINTINYATPHLSYFWERQDGWVSDNFEGRRYKKIAR